MSFLLFFRAFSELNFTTEGSQNYGRRDGHSAYRTCEGTSLVERERGVSFGLEGDIVVNFTADGAGADVGRSPFRNRGFNISTMAGQAIFAAVAEVANVIDSAAGRNHLHQRPVHAVERNFTAQ